MALATDPPTLALLHRKPEPKNSSIVTTNMWKMIIGQSLLQVVIIFILVFAGRRIFTDWSETELNTVVFNTFAWLQISNLINCRRIDNDLNVFSGVHRNYVFIAITFIMVGGQILIIYVGGTAFSITRINGEQWAISLILGLLSLPFGAIIRLIPNTYIEMFIPHRFLKSKTPTTPSLTNQDNVMQECSPEVLEFTKKLQSERSISDKRDPPPARKFPRLPVQFQSGRSTISSRSSSAFNAAIIGPVAVATSMMWSLSSPPTHSGFSISNRQDIDMFEGIELHQDTDPNDPVVGDGSAEFKLRAT